jgi:hypothetical protein
MSQVSANGKEMSAVPLVFEFRSCHQVASGFGLKTPGKRPAPVAESTGI